MGVEKGRAEREQVNELEKSKRRSKRREGAGERENSKREEEREK